RPRWPRGPAWPAPTAPRERPRRRSPAASGGSPTGSGCPARTTRTRAPRANLAHTYRSAGRLKDAIPQYERVVADMERLLPAGHRDALAARGIPGAAQPQG